MKKIMYVFSFLAFMTASNLNAQSNNCSKICPPGSCILNGDISQCTPAQKATCKAKASQASTETDTPKAIKASLVMEETEAKPKTACCSLFGGAKTTASCKKAPTKATNVAYKLESTAKTTCCDLPCCPAKPASGTKIACASKME